MAGPTAAVIVAAGKGERAGGGLPKQYRPVAGEAVVARAIRALRAHPEVDRVLVAIHPDHAAFFELAAAAVRAEPGAPVETVFGGAERQASVRLALEALAASSAPPSRVLIHDAARPFLPPQVVDRVLAALEARDGACAALAAADTLRRADDAGGCGDLVDRAGLWRAQTPQGFRFEAILAAHRAHAEEAFTDDAEIARRAGLGVALVEGAAEAAKITTPADFDWAERWARADGRAAARPTPAIRDVRIGQGFDVHKFGENADGSSDHVMLCGLRVPHETGLMGHSDADVGLHALTDAILGALASGDIGAHFPPSEARWHAASSDRFLAHAAQLAAAAGARLSQLDVTLICERPKIRPHVDAMRARVAEIAGVPAARVSVKATTTERLGFAGRGEGIAALASATLLFEA